MYTCMCVYIYIYISHDSVGRSLQGLGEPAGRPALSKHYALGTTCSQANQAYYYVYYDY